MEQDEPLKVVSFFPSDPYEYMTAKKNPPYNSPLEEPTNNLQTSNDAE